MRQRNSIIFSFELDKIGVQWDLGIQDKEGKEWLD